MATDFQRTHFPEDIATIKTSVFELWTYLGKRKRLACAVKNEVNENEEINTV